MPPSGRTRHCRDARAAAGTGRRGRRVATHALLATWQAQPSRFRRKVAVMGRSERHVAPDAMRAAWQVSPQPVRTPVVPSRMADVGRRCAATDEGVTCQLASKTLPHPGRGARCGCDAGATRAMRAAWQVSPQPVRTPVVPSRMADVGRRCAATDEGLLANWQVRPPRVRCAAARTRTRLRQQRSECDACQVASKASPRPVRRGRDEGTAPAAA